MLRISGGDQSHIGVGYGYKNKLKGGKMEEIKQMEIMKLAESGSPTVFLAILLLVCSKAWSFLIKFLSDKDTQIIELKKELAKEREFHRKETKDSRESYLKSLELITSKLIDIENEMYKINTKIGNK